jgi:hypothetical protein
MTMNKMKTRMIMTNMMSIRMLVILMMTMIREAITVARNSR